ncbi:hypothetical protein FACS189419_06990 [Planctomycetales bacterium]|nr:hypothetical protein FACS189419_06990 [Planctomycetales bacterium]
MNNTTLLDNVLVPLEQHTGEYLSATRLTTWMKCPLAYRLRYIDKMEQTTNPSLFVGKVVHAALAVIYRRQKEGKDTPISELPGLITGIWNEMLEVEPCFFDDDEHETKCRYQVVDLITAYLHNVDVRNEKVIAIERKFESLIQTCDTNDIFQLPLVGVIDLIIEKPEGLVIIDFKTAASASYCSLQHEIQLAAYAYLVREFFGQNEAKLEIRQLIKTKTPKIITQPYPPRNDWQMKRFFSLVREYHEALGTGTFNYRPSWNCSMCEHIEICQS